MATTLSNKENTLFLSPVKSPVYVTTLSKLSRCNYQHNPHCTHMYLTLCRNRDHLSHTPDEFPPPAFSLNESSQATLLFGVAQQPSQSFTFTQPLASTPIAADTRYIIKQLSLPACTYLTKFFCKNSHQSTRTHILSLDIQMHTTNVTTTTLFHLIHKQLHLTQYQLY